MAGAEVILAYGLGGRLGWEAASVHLSVTAASRTYRYVIPYIGLSVFVFDGYPLKFPSLIVLPTTKPYP